ncbi:GTP binding protein2 [Zea mays]|jgi:WD40 repeat protein|nr:GTP binding protein2 [Zea mays]
MFVSGSCDTTVRLWDIRIASRAVRTYHGHEDDVNSVKFFPDGHRFGTGSDDGTCRLFDMRTGHQLQVYSREPDRNSNELPTVTSIAFSISGRLLFAGYSNGDCYVWDTLLAEVCIFTIYHGLNTAYFILQRKTNAHNQQVTGTLYCFATVFLIEKNMTYSSLGVSHINSMLGNQLTLVI